MDDGDAPPPEEGDDFRALAEDWIAIWQSEITAFMTDPETQQAWGAMVALWANAAQTMMRAAPTPSTTTGQAPAKAPGRERAPKPARPPDATGATAPDAAPVSRDDEIGRLERRVAELERHLADADRRTRPPGDGRRPHRTGRSRG